MFFFKKKSQSDLDLSWLNADMHSHLIPGIDDGSPDIDTSIKLIKGLAGYGYKKLITTPHILWEIYPNTPEKITAGLDELKLALTREGIEIEIKAAAEYFIDEYLEQQLRSKVPFLTIGDNKVLVEYSMVTAPMDLKEFIFEMQLQNYQPVIAHPERYIYLSRKKEFYDDLKDSGCMFQLNLLSLIGHYGDSVQELAEYLIKKDYYDFAGTDLHGFKHLEALKKLSSSVLLKRVKDSGTIKNHTL
jgi:tyrosine-protein phosphatase YwqE